jgi:Rieske Fe-S protein
MENEKRIDDARASHSTQQTASANQTRRRFLWLLPATVFSSIIGTVAVAAARFLNAPASARQANETWLNVAPLSELNGSDPVMRELTFEQDEGWLRATKKQVVFVLPQKNNQVLSAMCPHQGCPVAWRKTERDFLCPCHGSQFSADGAVQTGPAQSDLPALPSRVVDGVLQVKLS